MADPIAKGVTNSKDGSLVEAKVAADGLVFFCPQHAEVIVVPPEKAPAFLAEMAQMNTVLGNLIDAREQLGTQQAFLWESSSYDANKQAAAEKKLAEALKKEAEAREEVQKALSAIPSANKDGSLLELLPMWSKNGKNVLPKGYKMTYVRSEKVKNHWRRYQLSNADKPQLKSFLVKDETTGRYQISQDKLADAMKETQLKIKQEYKWIDEEKNRVQWSPEFIGAFNKNANFANPADSDDMAEFSGGATLLRAFAGVSAGSSFEAGNSWQEVLQLKGQIKGALKGKAEAGASLADGILSAKFYLPYQGGFELIFPFPGKKEDRTLGFFRLLIEGTLSGNCGASVLAEGGIEFTIGVDGSQKMQGKPVPRHVKQLHIPKLNVSANVDAKQEAGVELTAFAGAQAQAAIKGAFQWRKPAVKDFADFATIEPKAAAQAGIGAVAAFKIEYRDGKFRIFIKLGVCVGLGLKGAIEAVVGAAQLWEFACWYKHQVMLAGDKLIKYFDPDAFVAFCRVYLLSIIESKPMSAYFGLDDDQLKERLARVIQKNFSQVVERLKNSKDELLNSLAEIKRMLLDLLVDYYKKYGDAFGSVKAGIIDVLDQAQLKNEFNNIFQHQTVQVAEGLGATRSEVAAIVGEDYLTALYARLKTEPSPGYPLVSNTSLAYQHQSGTHVAWNEDFSFQARDSMLA